MDAMDAMATVGTMVEEGMAAVMEPETDQRIETDQEIAMRIGIAVTSDTLPTASQGGIGPRTIIMSPEAAIGGATSVIAIGTVCIHTATNGAIDHEKGIESTRMAEVGTRPARLEATIDTNPVDTAKRRTATAKAVKVVKDGTTIAGAHHLLHASLTRRKARLRKVQFPSRHLVSSRIVIVQCMIVQPTATKTPMSARMVSLLDRTTYHLGRRTTGVAR